MEQRTRRWSVRLLVRTIALIVSVIFASQVLRKDLATVLPSMSPFLAVFSAIAMRSVSLIFLLCLPVLVLGLLKGRWFCRHVCPTGLLAEYAGRLGGASNAKLASLPRLGRYIVLFALGGALLGYPVFLWLDPLSIFNGFVSVWHKPLAPLRLLPGVGLLVILALSVWRPGAWCYRFCPLGFSQEMLGKLGRYVRARVPRRRLAAGHSANGVSGVARASGHLATGPPTWQNAAFRGEGPKVGRRMFLAAIIGGVVGALARNVTGRQVSIRPPGSVDEERFAGICARCGNCIRACPENIIQPDLGETGVSGFLTPVIRIGPKYCTEWCNECNKVCPSNAIEHMTLQEKLTVSIGTARVTKSRCLAWNQSRYCIVCNEYCPYHAVKLIEHNGVNCPEVDPDICRGCGLCQTVCPAQSKAIIIHGQPQRKLKPVEM